MIHGYTGADVQTPLPQSRTNISSTAAVCKAVQRHASHASCEIYMDFHLLRLQYLHFCNALRGLYSNVGIVGDGYGKKNVACENQICTTHIQNLLFPSFVSKF